MDDNLVQRDNADGSISLIPKSVYDYKPAVGRIVQFFRKNERQGEAALITRVHNENCVNLTVFVNGEATPVCYSSVTNNPNDSFYWIPPPIK